MLWKRVSLLQQYTPVCAPYALDIIGISSVGKSSCKINIKRYASSHYANSPPVFQKALEFPNRIALTDVNGTHLYGDLYRDSGTVADLLHSTLGPDCEQERIAFLCPSDKSYVITQWATWMAGHIAVPLYPRHPKPQLEYFIKDSDASVIVTTNEYKETITSISSERKVIVLDDKLRLGSKNTKNNAIVYPEEAGGIPMRGKEDAFYTDKDAMILYTSGTTGPPKGVVLSHNNLKVQVNSLLQAWAWGRNDVILHCLPLHHTHGIVNALMCPLSVGARCVMLEKFDAAEVWRKLLSLDESVFSRVSVFMAVPTIYALLIQEYNTKLVSSKNMRDFVKGVCKQNIRLMVSGSAALPQPIYEEWSSLTGHSLLERYGMTEIGMALSAPLKGARKAGYVGQPLPGVEVRIAKFAPNDRGHTIICEGNMRRTKVTEGKEEEIGELMVKGDNVFSRYWRKPEETKKEFTSDGQWFRTGDTAQYSTDGGYKILGRTSVDIIKSGAFKISALDVERHMLAYPLIADCTVVGVSDLTWGKQVAAVVVWKPLIEGSDKEEIQKLKDWLRARIPHYQVPTIVKVVDEVPRNSMGKVNKKALLEDMFKGLA